MSLHVVRDEFLDGRLVAGDARNGDHLLQKLDRLVAAGVDLVEDFLVVGVGHWRCLPCCCATLTQSDFRRGMISRAMVSI